MVVRISSSSGSGCGDGDGDGGNSSTSSSERKKQKKKKKKKKENRKYTTPNILLKIVSLIASELFSTYRVPIVEFSKSHSCHLVDNRRIINDNHGGTDH